MKFKKLEIEPEGNWIKRTFASPHFIKTMIYGLIGAIAGYALFYFEQRTDATLLWNEDALKNVLMGLALGVFITNSPCARGRC